MENKTIVSQAVQEIVASVKTLAASGRYPRKGWKYEVTEMMENEKLCNNTTNLSAIKETYCTWCKKCNHDLCLDRAPIPCRIARVYEKRLAVLMNCEEAERLGASSATKNKDYTIKKYNTDNLHNLFKAVNRWITNNFQKIIPALSEEDQAFLCAVVAHFEKRNFGLLKTTLEKAGVFKRGRKKETALKEINTLMCKIIKEVF